MKVKAKKILLDNKIIYTVCNSSYMAIRNPGTVTAFCFSAESIDAFKKTMPADVYDNAPVVTLNIDEEI